MSALVRLVGVSKTFGDAAAVHAVDLSVERGKTTVLIGPSGCGKSTLLRLIIGLLGPDSGEIQFDRTQLRRDKIDIVRHRAGYVIQEGGLFPHLTARGNILLMARHLGRPENEIHARLSELRALTRFPENLLDRYPLELSGGQRQRVSLMRALIFAINRPATLFPNLSTRNGASPFYEENQENRKTGNVHSYRSFYLRSRVPNFLFGFVACSSCRHWFQEIHRVLCPRRNCEALFD